MPGGASPSASIEVSARGCSSRATTTGSPFFCGTVHGHDLPVEQPALDRGDGPLVRAQREGVLALARDVVRGAVALDDVLGGLAHRVRVVERGQLRVDEPPAERRVLELARAAVPRRPRPCPCTNGARVIDSTPPAMNTSPSSDGDRVGGGVDRLEAGAAQPVDRLARDLDRQARRAATAIRATLRLSSPAWFAQPRITSSIERRGRSPSARRRRGSRARRDRRAGPTASAPP